MNTPTRIPISPRLYCLLSAVGLSATCIATPAFAQDEATEGADDDVYVMNPFMVSAEDNSGYVASNSISGTRSQTPIRENPLNIQVFTEDFAGDLQLTSQVDVERYNASLVNGGDDQQSNNVIQQSYNGFLFRGFVQNWALRDGVRQYDPVDMQGLSRVEIVKGPVAAMYGVTYPGGVMKHDHQERDLRAQLHRGQCQPLGPGRVAHHDRHQRAG
jgi:outer membrane receptor protein involved in Fe transport